MAGITETRLKRLEAAYGIHQAERRVFLVRFQTNLTPDPLTGVEVGNVHFRRSAGEDEQEFLDRVIQTAPPADRDAMLTVLMEAS